MNSVRSIPRLHPTQQSIASSSNSEKPQIQSKLKIAAISLIAFSVIVGMAIWLNRQHTPEEFMNRPVKCPYGTVDGKVYDLHYYLRAAEEKKPEAGYCLAQMYLKGENGAEKSSMKAKEWLYNSACAGSKQAEEEYNNWRDQICGELMSDTLAPEEDLLAIRFCHPGCFCTLPIDREPDGINNPKLVQETLSHYKAWLKNIPLQRVTFDQCKYPETIS